jgi:hypothetical protein
MYNLETTGKPGISFLGGHDPVTILVLQAFHNTMGRPESHLTYGDGFYLEIAKGESVKDALLRAAEELRTTNKMAEASREHVPKLLANL